MTLNLSGLPLPLSVRPAVALTDEELMRFSAENKPYKIERNKEGEITIMTPVGGIGGTHEYYVNLHFGMWNEQDGAGRGFGPNTGFNLPDGSCLSPDVAWLSLARWNALSPSEQGGYPPVCPEFVIEIRSRTDARRLLEAKMQLWLDDGAQLAWLIDPIDATVSIYRPNEPSETLERPDVVQGHAPVGSFVLRTTPLWPAL